MAKKPPKRRHRRAAARSEHVEAKGAFARNAFQSDSFQTARTGGRATARGELTLTPKPIVVVPTPYPADPTAQLSVSVYDYLQVDVTSALFKNFNKKLEQVLAELQRSNQVAGELRQRLSAELKAGQTLLSGPKPDRNLVKLLLEHPLSWLASAMASALLGELAHQAYELLSHILSQAPQIPL